MAIFGLGGSAKTKKSTKAKAKAGKGKSRQNSEAKAVLKKMAAKKDAGDCAFC